MIVHLKPSALRQTLWYEYLVRLVLGGAMTVIAGLIAARFGPVVGGLFLAFPAIFPASATLIEKHVRERKEKAGFPGTRRGKEAVPHPRASVDSKLWWLTAAQTRCFGTGKTVLGTVRVVGRLARARQHLTSLTTAGKRSQ
jgi:Protein of unknown function (DUF3147)